jgi:hypothetical protein
MGGFEITEKQHRTQQQAYLVNYSHRIIILVLKDR